jgi:hypothetical protein
MKDSDTAQSSPATPPVATTASPSPAALRRHASIYFYFYDDRK